VFEGVKIADVVLEKLGVFQYHSIRFKFNLTLVIELEEDFFNKPNLDSLNHTFDLAYK
jgi:hypothetical protein